jgi:hypothetical protein
VSRVSRGRSLGVAVETRPKETVQGSDPLCLPSGQVDGPALGTARRRGTVHPGHDKGLTPVVARGLP